MFIDVNYNQYSWVVIFLSPPLHSICKAGCMAHPRTPPPQERRLSACKHLPSSRPSSVARLQHVGWANQGQMLLQWFITFWQHAYWTAPRWHGCELVLIHFELWLSCITNMQLCLSPTSNVHHIASKSMAMSHVVSICSRKTNVAIVYICLQGHAFFCKI